MSQRFRRISRIVGLSTERQPSALRTGESPFLQNVDLDQGGVCRVRNGYTRLTNRPFRDASWRLRGAPYLSSLTATEFHDYLVIPHSSRCNISSENFYLSMIITPRRNALGAFNVEQMIINKGPDTDLRFRVHLEFSTNYQWHLSAHDSGTGTVKTTSVTDTTFAIDAPRLVEVYDDFSNCYIRISDASDGSVIGTGTISTFGFFDLGAAGAADGYPWLIGAYPDSTGFAPEFDIGNLATDENFGSFSIAEIRMEKGFSSTPFLLNASTSLPYTDERHKRELLPIETNRADVIHYYKCNEASYGQLLDWCDSDVNPVYFGSYDGVHGLVGNVAPVWLTETNEIRVDVTENPDIASDYKGLSLVNQYGLLFNGYEGIIFGRTGDISHTSATNDPLEQVYEQSPATDVGWTAEIVITPLLRTGETSHHDCTLYASGAAASTAVLPVRIKILSDQFVAEFDDGTSTKTITLTGNNVSDYAGEKVTLSLTRGGTSGQTLTFRATGENKQDSGFVVTAATSPSITSSASGGPFISLCREVDNMAITSTDDPLDYTGRAFYGVFHEFRLWARERVGVDIIATANEPITVGNREGLVVYLVPDVGEGNVVGNFGESVTLTVTDASGTYQYPQTPVIDNRILPAQERGPVPDEGLVETYQPVECRMLEDYRITAGDGVSREVLVVAGASLYTFNLATNTLTMVASGIFKRDQLFDSRVFIKRAIFANGSRPYVYSKGALRRAGISRPVHRLKVNLSAGGTTGDGTYYITYRWVNSRDQVYSQMAPLREFTLGSGDNTIASLDNIEVPNDPQVDTVEIFVSIPGGSTTTPPGQDTDGVSFLYRLDQINTGVGVFRTTSYTPSSAFADLSNDVNSLDAVRFDHIFRNGVPPATRALEVLGTRVLYGAQNLAGAIYFSRIDGFIQPEHVDLSPGLEAQVSIDVDAADTINAILAEDDAAIVYGRDTRAEITQSGLDPSATGGLEVPFQISIKDYDKGCVSPKAARPITGAHIFLHENDVMVRADREYRFLSSPPEQITAIPQANIGRTIRGLSRSNLWRAILMHRDAKQQAWFAVADDASKNNIVLIYSYRDRKWMRHTIPIDHMVEVEAADDGNIPIGAVNGFICRLDHDGVTIDGAVPTADQDGKTFDGVELTVSAVTPSLNTLSISGTTSEQLRFQMAWIGSSGAYYQYRLNYLHDISGNANILYDKVNSTDPDPQAGDTVYVGSRFPVLDVILKPVTATSFKAFRLVEVAVGEDGWANAEIVAWFGNEATKRDPAVSTADIQGQAMNGSNDAWVIGDIMGGGHVTRLRLQAPAPNEPFSIADMNATHDAKATGFVDG